MRFHCTYGMEETHLSYKKNYVFGRKKTKKVHDIFQLYYDNKNMFNNKNIGFKIFTLYGTFNLPFLCFAALFNNKPNLVTSHFTWNLPRLYLDFT